MKYRKKPIVFEAFQMTEKRRWDNSDWPNWLHKAWREGSLRVDSMGQLLCGIRGKGVYRIDWGDWIIKGVKNKLRACDPYIFTDVYEPVEEY